MIFIVIGAILLIYGLMNFLREHWILFFLITSVVFLGAVLLPRPIQDSWRAWATLEFPEKPGQVWIPSDSSKPRPSADYTPGIGELLSSDARWSQFIDERKWQQAWNCPTPGHALNEFRQRLAVVPAFGKNCWRLAVRESSPVLAAERSNEVAAFLVTVSREIDQQQVAASLNQLEKERIAQQAALESSEKAVILTPTGSPERVNQQQQATRRLQALRWTEAQIASLTASAGQREVVRVISVAQASQAGSGPLNAILLGIALLSAWGLGALLVWIHSRSRLPVGLLTEIGRSTGLPIIRPAEWNGRHRFTGRELRDPDHLRPNYESLAAELARLPAGDCLVLALVPDGGCEGFAEVIVRLADGFAKTGQSVLLIDAEMRRPTLHSYLEAAPQPGLADYLTGEMRMGETIYKTRCDSLWLIPSGPRPEDPSLLLSGKRFDDLLWQMRSRFEVILIACPVLQEYSETVSMIGHVDHVIAVTPTRQLSRSRFAAFAKAVRDHQGKLSGLLTSCRENVHSTRQNELWGSKLRLTSAR
jgi:hypothetical protein